jgi:hypothetical protein
MWRRFAETFALSGCPSLSAMTYKYYRLTACQHKETRLKGNTMEEQLRLTVSARRETAAKLIEAGNPNLTKTVQSLNDKPNPSGLTSTSSAARDRA